MAGHVPLGDKTINDHETRIERLEEQVRQLTQIGPSETIANVIEHNESQPRRPGRPPKNKET